MALAKPHHPVHNRNRLPTLAEVLDRKSAFPVDLYAYYLFLQSEGSEDNLDFWLDVHQHEVIVRNYFRDLSKNGRSVKEEWPRYYDIAKKRGSAWNGMNGVTQDAVDEEGDESQAEESGEVNNEKSRAQTEEEPQYARQTLSAMAMDDSDEARHLQRTPSPTSNGPRPNYSANFSPTLRALYNHDRGVLTPSPGAGSETEFGANMQRDGGNVGTTASSSLGHKRRSLGIVSSMRGKGGQATALPVIPRDKEITRTDLIASAEHIYVLYLMPGAAKEIYLPNVLRVTEFPISSSQLPHTYSEPNHDVENDTLARVPDMFHSQKEWVYRAMEQDSFPRFLRSKAFGNLTPVSAMIRLIVGLLLMWVALSTSLAFIFLDVKPKSKRLWIILPYTLAFLLILSYAYDLDPITVLWGVSETTTFRTQRVRELYVKKLLVGRAVWVIFLTAVLVTCVTLLFTLVPGHRL